MPTRTRGLLLRVSPQEYAELQSAASRAGLGLGPWIRSVALAMARTEATAKRIRRIFSDVNLQTALDAAVARRKGKR